jgi:UDPglucose--hexose-1-phosphate uridylyltransferase
VAPLPLLSDGHNEPGVIPQMAISELRKDPVVDRWVIIATERSKRPHANRTTAESERDEPCPFCSGREGDTPPEVLAYRDPSTPANTPGWRVRVVPNKYPALAAMGDISQPPASAYVGLNGLGAHEVIVESPKHCLSMSELSEGQVEEILWAYRQRLIVLQNDQRWKSILIYKNEGSAAGATLEHVHSQLLALPIVPREIDQEWRALVSHHDATNGCLYCEMLDTERADGRRIIFETAAFMAFCPFASRFPLEIWLMPKEHSPAFDAVANEDLRQLAFMLWQSLQRLARIVDAPLNYVIHSAPLREPRRERYHWHLEILPRITKIAGFELASGFYINTVAPEIAARQLREIVL